jgi:Uma2 family endonuclease
MGAALELSPSVSVLEYLDGELVSEVRHEYFGGRVFAMAGASRNHERVGRNVMLDLGGHLEGKPCELFKGDLKARLKINREDVFFYPDFLVTCDPKDDHPFYSDKPKVIIEILSGDNQRDLVEKFLMYQTLATLEEYIVLSQDPLAPRAYVHRRADGWEQEIVEAGGTLEIRSLGWRVELARLYRGML